MEETTNRIGRPLWGRVGIVLLLLSIAMGITGYLLGVANGHQDASSLGLFIAFPTYSLVGALIVSRQPGNAMGWIFCGVGFVSAASVFSAEYASQTLVADPGSLPAGIWMAWAGNWLWFPTLCLAVLLPAQLFPTGRPINHRWRPLLWLTVLLTVGMTVSAMVPERFELQEKGVFVNNPLGIASINVEKGLLGSVTTLLFLVVTLGGIAAMIVRFRRSYGIERQQIKWFTFAVAFLFLIPLTDYVPLGDFTIVWDAFVLPALIAFVAVAAGIAILRYRLYDIDVVINRTLVYASLTAVLAGSYLLIVVALQAVLPTGGNQLAVAGSTLAVAALFQPLRTRLQSFIDRRFYRQKYDAAETLGDFSARLRDQVDLDSLHRELVTVVTETMQPTHASLWLRKAAP